MPRDRRRDRNRSRSARRSSSGDEDTAGPGQPLYRLELLPGRNDSPWRMFALPVDDDEGGAQGGAAAPRIVSHVCSRPGQGYVIRVTNESRRHIACAVTVDGANTLLRDGSLIVAPHDSRELQGFLVSKNFIGEQYVKEYRNFLFGKPRVVDDEASVAAAGGSTDQVTHYKTYGRVCCEIFDAVLDEEVDSDQELRGQTTHYRGAGHNGSYDEKLVPEGKKAHFMFSAVTVQGGQSALSNSTRGRWWIRGPRLIDTLEVRYKEAHSLMLLGVSPKALGIPRCKQEDGGQKKEEKDEKSEDEDTKDSLQIDVCDLTEDSERATPQWSTREKDPLAQPVDIDRS